MQRFRWVFSRLSTIQIKPRAQTAFRALSSANLIGEFLFPSLIPCQRSVSADSDSILLLNGNLNLDEGNRKRGSLKSWANFGTYFGDDLNESRLSGKPRGVST